MPDVQQGGIVIWLRPAEDRLQVAYVTNIGGPVSNAVLEYNHPGYSSIYTLLMASGVNQKQITLDVIADDAGLQTIQWAQLNF